MSAQGYVTREKRETTVMALCALQGIVMHASIDDHGREAYLVTLGPLTRELPSLDAVEAWLKEQ